MKKSAIVFLVLAGLSGPAARAADYTNSIGMQFNNIPAGRFYMGTCRLSEAHREADKKRKFMFGLWEESIVCSSEDWRNQSLDDDESPQHEVCIGRGFRMGVHEVTLEQFKQYIAAAGRDDLLNDDFIRYNRDRDSNGDDYAVTWVSWDDAQRFIGWLNKKEGTRAYRLPSEAEWEYAARAGTTTRYSWGDAIGRNRASCVGCSSRLVNFLPVGSFEPNAFGLYDMHGSVWEWVADCWHDSYEDAPTDGSAWTNGCVSNSAVIRGGGWDTTAVELRVTARYWGYVGPLPDRDKESGFRLVQDLNP